MKTNPLSLFIVSLLICFSLSPMAPAVTPAPDGGYSGGNTAEGQAALLSLTTGTYNAAIGVFSLLNDATGNFNTGVGAGTLLSNTADENTATGAGALLSNTTGNLNTANGAFALFTNTTGVDNTATGGFALESNTIGSENTGSGVQALEHNTTGDGNTANGFQALFNNTTGARNTADGISALASNTTGHGNTAVGNGALFVNTTGSENIAIGEGAGSNVSTANNVICIGAAGNDVANSCYIGNIFNATSSGGAAVFINTNGRLGTVTSSGRFKDDVKPMDTASEELFALKPVTFRYKKMIDPKQIPQFGLIAEEVEKINPELVVRDDQGKPYSVRYDQVNAMLLNEFLKAHRKIQELEAKNAEQQRNFMEQQTQIEALTTAVQKVSAQLQVSKSTPQSVANDQ
jgi:endosialidase-like protein